MSNFYTWPNAAFPFRLYLNRPECRIFIIENIFHNYNWLKEVKDNIKDTDFFFVISGWNMSDHICQTNKKVLESLGINLKQFFILYNDLDEMAYGGDAGFQGDLIPHNTWLDEDKLRIESQDKIYDALYIARASPFKRHMLASDIQNLALAAGGLSHNNKGAELPNCKNDAHKFYNRQEIVTLMNQSHCGLCLSEEEGGCFSSSEYLLCGIPVISTPCKGGRDIWYNMNNSIMAEPNKEDIARAVKQIIEKKLDPELIREEHIKKMGVFRGKFVYTLAHTLNRFGVNDINAEQFFHDSFFEKMRTSMNEQDVISIFS